MGLLAELVLKILLGLVDHETAKARIDALKIQEANRMADKIEEERFGKK